MLDAAAVQRRSRPAGRGRGRRRGGGGGVDGRICWCLRPRILFGVLALSRWSSGEAMLVRRSLYLVLNAPQQHNSPYRSLHLFALKRCSMTRVAWMWNVRSPCLREPSSDLLANKDVSKVISCQLLGDLRSCTPPPQNSIHHSGISVLMPAAAAPSAATLSAVEPSTMCAGSATSYCSNCASNCTKRSKAFAVNATTTTAPTINTLTARVASRFLKTSARDASNCLAVLFSVSCVKSSCQ